MSLGPWFVVPLAVFVVLALVRVWLAIAHFDSEGSMPEHSFDIATGTVPTVDTFGAILAAAASVLGGQLVNLPPVAIAFASAVAVLFSIGAVTGYYLQAMVPRFQTAQDKHYRFDNAFYPSVKAVFVTAQFVMILTAAAFVVYLVVSVAAGQATLDPAAAALAGE